MVKSFVRVICCIFYFFVRTGLCEWFYFYVLRRGERGGDGETERQREREREKERLFNVAFVCAKPIVRAKCILCVAQSLTC